MSDVPGPLDLLKALTGFQADPYGFTEAQDMPPKLATIDPAYTGVGNPKVTFDGETTMGTRTYTWIGSPPVPSSRVLMLPVGRTYVILGGLGTYSLGALRVLSGRGTTLGIAAANGGNSGLQTVPFPAGFFTAIPRVTVTAYTGRLTPGLNDARTNGFDVNFTNATSGNAAISAFDWIAVQM